MPFGKEIVVVLGTTRDVATVRMNCFDASGEVPFEALAVRVNVPAAVGVPKITPVLLRYNPSGKLPSERLQATGAVPAAASVAS